MALHTCKCGCTVFETILVHQFNEAEFNVDSRSKNIPIAVSCIPVAKCIRCQRIDVPSTSLAGISALDARVKGYAAVLEAVEYRNSTISDMDIYPSMIASVEAKVNELAQKECACAAKEEVTDVKAATRGGKKSQAVVS